MLVGFYCLLPSYDNKRSFISMKREATIGPLCTVHWHSLEALHGYWLLLVNPAPRGPDYETLNPPLKCWFSFVENGNSRGVVKEL